MTLDVLYFAWVRERIGTAQEKIETSADTVDALLTELSGKGERYMLALSDRRALRVALDQELVDITAPLAGAREVAIFPPMTGG